MDSITQGLLGAVTFAVIKEKDIGKKALLIGAFAGTIPDLDVLLASLFNDIAFLTVHRSVSHSIIFAILLSFILGEIFHRSNKKKHARWGWNFAFFLSIMTHSLLDWCTTYGTKLLSPFSGHLFSLNNIHVFQPTYTLILLIGVIAVLVQHRSKAKRKTILNYTLGVSTVFIFWTLISKGIAVNNFVGQLKNQNIKYKKLIVSPSPLNSILWHGIAKSEKGYYIGSYSLLDQREKIEFYFEESHNTVIPKIKKNRLVKYYLDYTQGFPLIKRDDKGNIKIYAIKYGPINYSGKPEFVYPLCLNEDDLTDEKIKIDYSGKQRGPVKNYKKLFKRIKGV